MSTDASATPDATSEQHAAGSHSAASHAAPVHAGEDLSADEFGDHQHGATDKKYIVVAAILAVITAMEVAISYLDIGPLFLPLLLILMAIKFLTVVSYFMHLKYDHRLFSVVFYMGLLLALSVYIGALAAFHFFAG